jgi:hypothetical protein
MHASWSRAVDRRKQVDVTHLHEGDGVLYGGGNFDKQSDPQKVFAGIWDLESEINNAGFAQYFFSSIELELRE